MATRSREIGVAVIFVFDVVAVVVVVADCDSSELVFVAFAVAAFAVVAFVVAAFAVAAFAVVAFAVVAFVVAAIGVVAAVNNAGAVQESNLLKARLGLNSDVAWVAWVA